MKKGLKIWCDSGANIHSCREEFVEFGDGFMSEEEWHDLSDDKKEETAKEIAFERLDWGYEVVDKR